jgi:hypothetical protein
MQFDWQGDRYIDHTALITGLDSSGMPYLTYHSNDHKDRSFSDFRRAADPTTVFYAWRIS